MPISPNGDNINDSFIPVVTEDSYNEIRSLQIFDRWGNRLYEFLHFSPNDPSYGWKKRAWWRSCNSRSVCLSFRIGMEKWRNPKVLWWFECNPLTKSQNNFDPPDLIFFENEDYIIAKNHLIVVRRRSSRIGKSSSDSEKHLHDTYPKKERTYLSLVQPTGQACRWTFIFVQKQKVFLKICRINFKTQSQ